MARVQATPILGAVSRRMRLCEHPESEPDLCTDRSSMSTMVCTIKYTTTWVRSTVGHAAGVHKADH